MRCAAVALALVLPNAALAQADDRDALTAFLEDNLSGAGRVVTITGFEGALSSRATMERLQIADDTGVWITLEDVVLDWSRSSLLSGKVVVNELSAAAILLDRLPVMPADDSLPAPEAGGFALPDLPVSIEIGAIRADRIVLGEPVLGEPVEGRFEAALSLAGGEGAADLVLERTDGPESRIALEASYSNASARLALDLSAREAAGGIAARMLDLPGAPSVDLTIAGAGTLADFTADVRLASDGVDRLAGPVELRQAEDGAQGLSAQLTGNLAPLFLPEYADFLGDSVALGLEATLWPTGRKSLEQLVLKARALDLEGSVVLAADGLPEAFDLDLVIAQDGGAPVLLPLPGETRNLVRRAEITLAFDARQGNGWSGQAVLDGLDSGTLRLDRARIAGSGRIDRAAGRNGIGATLDFSAGGLALADAALQEALGTDLAGGAILFWREGQDSLRLPQLRLEGAGFTLEGGLRLEGLDTGLNTSGRLRLVAEDLSRFSALAGMPLAGAAEVDLEGQASRLSGKFDLALQVVGTGLKAGIAELDRLMAGTTRLTASARRDETGIALRNLGLEAGALALTASGTLASGGSDLSGSLRLADLGALRPGWAGSLVADAGFTGTPENGRLSLSGKGARLSLGQARIDRLLAGDTLLDLAFQSRDGTILLEQAKLNGSNLTAEAKGGRADGSLDVTGRLRDLALLAEGYPGPVSLSGRLTPLASGAGLDLRILGPAAIDLRVAGEMRGTRADLSIQGTTDAALLNVVADPATLAGALRLDLALRGPLAISSLSGRVALSGGRIAVPYRGLSLTRTELVADIAGGRARLAATAELTAGGRLRLGGDLGMAAPFNANLDLQLEALRMRDPELYETVVSGPLRISGPLLGRALLSGRLTLGDTELRIPESGYASASDLEAIRHLGDSAEVRATRARAGLGAAGKAGGQGGGGSGPDWALDVTIDAPNRIFLRGRGLDAELGGSVTLGGTLRSVAPSGSIQLVRGRLDLLGKRLVLSEASIDLQGDLVPYVAVAASNETEGVVSFVRIEGPANAPEVTFSSVPELPQEEVLSWLLFGRGLDTISALQAAELANAVAVLAGRGGEGIVSRLRRGFGLDDLDVSTAEDGTTSVTAGKYLSKNLYTGVEVDQNGKSQINLNLDLRKGVTVKGRVGSDGETGIGIFLEGDY